MCFGGDLLAGLRRIVNRLIESAFGSINELGKGVLEICDSLIFGGYLVDQRLRFPVGFNLHFTHDLFIWDDEGTRESRKRQKVDKLHDCYGGKVNRCEQEGEKGVA